MKHYTTTPISFNSPPLQNGYMPARLYGGEIVPLGMYPDLIGAELHLLDEPHPLALSRIRIPAAREFSLIIYLFEDGKHVDSCLYLDLSDGGNWSGLRSGIARYKNLCN